MANSNTFASALTSASNIVLNRKGGEMLSTSGDRRLDAFTNLNKDTSVEDIRSKITGMVKEIKDASVNTTSSQSQPADPDCNSEILGEYIADIFRIWVHKRHAREGEKEKILSYRYFLELFEFFPETCITLARSTLFGEIGYWKDYYLIWRLINEKELADIDRYNKYNKLICGFRHSILTQRQTDLCKLKEYVGARKLASINNTDLEQVLKDKSKEEGVEKLTLSYVGKYCVREKSSMNKELYWYVDDNGTIKRESHVSFMIRGSLKIREGDGYIRYPGSKSVPFDAKKTYRNMNAKLNIFLNVPECFMCADRFGEMVPETFPSVFMKKNTKGLLNEKLKVAPTGYEEDTGNRHPYDEGRIALRYKMKEMFTDPSKVNAGQVFPHEICYKAFSSTSTMEMAMFEAMWGSKIIETKERLDATRLKIANEIGGMGRMCSSDRIRLALSSGNFVGCADVSGSMEWADKPPNRPIDIAMGLTVFMSEIASPVFRNLALSFTTEPRVMNFSGMSLKEKLNKIKEYVGYSTNYEGLHKALIDLCVSNHVKEEDIPVIVVYTDGDFDSMDPYVKGGRWKSIHSKIVSMWVSAGYKKIPTMVYWNLNRDSMGVQEDKDHEGIMFLQGRSATNIKYILYGECAEEKEKVVDGVKVKVSSITPYETFRKAMDQEHFADLEAILRRSNEGVLQYYK